MKKVFAFIVFSTLAIMIMFQFGENGLTKVDSGASNSGSDEVERVFSEKILLDYVEEKLYVPEKGIKSNFLDNHENDYEVMGDEFLSESIGLIMEYAVRKNDKELFDKYFYILDNRYLNTEGYIPWVLTNEGTKKSQSGASIDDLRIAYATRRAYEVWKDVPYLESYGRIDKNIRGNLINENGALVDSYSWPDICSSGRVKLSYLNFEFVEKLDLSKRKMQSIKKEFARILLEGKYADSPFYRVYYYPDKDQYSSEEEVNLIDTTLTAINLAYLGVPQDSLLDWYEEEFNEKGRILGRYSPYTMEPSVGYDSIAVYSLVSNLALIEERKNFSQRIMNKIQGLQDLREGSITYGGFVDLETHEGHAFDSLEALLALDYFY